DTWVSQKKGDVLSLLLTPLLPVHSTPRPSMIRAKWACIAWKLVAQQGRGSSACLVELTAPCANQFNGHLRTSKDTKSIWVSHRRLTPPTSTWKRLTCSRTMSRVTRALPS